MLDLGLLAAFFAVIFSTFSNISFNYTAARINNYKLTTLIMGVGVLFTLPVLVFSGQTSIGLAPAIYSLVSGVFFGAALYFTSRPFKQNKSRTPLP